MTEREIFVAALQVDDSGDRQRYLAVACGNDASLNSRVQALLNAIGRAGDFLQSPAEAAVGYSPIEENKCTGAMIGPYKLLEPIGEGGMGIVYVAE